MTDEVREWSLLNKILNGHKINNYIDAPIQIIKSSNLKWNSDLYHIKIDIIYPKPEEEEQKKAEREESWRTVEPSRMEPKFS